MKISNDYPPNYEQICNAFPEVRESPNVVFTYGDTLFVPNGNETISTDLDVHETYHSEQQLEMGPEAWWEKYLEDPIFRARQEVGAYQRQFRYARRHYPKAFVKLLVNRFAADLSGPIYGNIYSKVEAKKLIKQKPV